jgi:hypothetical protein
MKQMIALSVILFLFTSIYTQPPDSSKRNIPETWKRFHIAPRLGFGLHRSFFSEYGLALQRYLYNERHGFAVTTYYASFNWVPPTKGEKPVTGIKAGAEVIHNGSGGAIELNYITDGDSTDVLITPKLGFGIGVVNLFYGYNFSTNKYPFSRIGKHQFSLVINTNIFLYHLKHKSLRK